MKAPFPARRRHTARARQAVGRLRLLSAVAIGVSALGALAIFARRPRRATVDMSEAPT